MCACDKVKGIVDEDCVRAMVKALYDMDLYDTMNVLQAVFGL